MPDDHLIVVVDIAGSTAAVRDGRYREVNYVGGAAIAAALNVTDGADLPFVFGGDGATLVAPPELMPQIAGALCALRAHAAETFDFDLRVGAVPVRDIRAAGHGLSVCRFPVSPSYTQALFLGSGLAYAEDAVKDDAMRTRYEIEAPDDVDLPPDLYAGLECRWEDVASPAGETLTLLVTATASADEERLATYRDVIGTIEEVYGDGDAPHPIAPERLRLSRTPRRFSAEVKLRHADLGWRQSLKLWVLNLIGIALIRYKVETSETDWAAYPRLLRQATDFRKFDGMLRMVLAGTPGQRHLLETYLDARYQEGTLAYGVHVSDRAVLTCLVYERMGRQVHFVDGADGGYTLAAADMKQRVCPAPQPV